MAVALTRTGIEAAQKRVDNGGREELVDDREPGLRIRVGERSAKWSVMIRRPSGERIRVPLGAWPGVGISEARKAAQAKKREVEQGINPNEVRRASRQYETLAELIEAYQKARLVDRSRGDKTKRAIEAALKPFLKRNPATITADEIAREVDKLAKSAPVAANRSLAYVRAFFGWAVGKRKLATNPAEKLEKPTEERARTRTPSLAELVEIWNAAESLGYPFGPAVQLLMATAMRREEIGALAVAELDLEATAGPTFTIPAERSKNGEAFRVPLSPLAMTALSPALGARPIVDAEKKTKAPLVFTTTGETAASGWSKAKVRLDRLIVEARAKAGEKEGRDPDPLVPWRLHDLRRSFATLACDVLHVDRSVADRCLNHVASTTTTTIGRVYGRSEMLDQRRAALNAWGALLDREINPTTSNVVPLETGRAA